MSRIAKFKKSFKGAHVECEHVSHGMWNFTVEIEINPTTILKRTYSVFRNSEMGYGNPYEEFCSIVLGFLLGDLSNPKQYLKSDLNDFWDLFECRSNFDSIERPVLTSFQEQ